MASSNRPLSPHLQVYRVQITSGLSILHRITGMGLGLGTLLIAWWLIAAAAGPEAFATAQAFMGSIIGRIILFGFTVILLYHALNGIRHLVWDAGYGLEVDVAGTLGWLVLGATAALSVLLWLFGYAMRS